jgi:Nuclease-related domain
MGRYMGDVARFGGRAAGQHARGQAHALTTRMLVAIGLLLLLLLGAGPVLGLQGPALIGVELVALAAMIGANRAYSSRSDRWLQGAEGEESVGRVLEGLEAQGWYAVHDVSLGRGNVDHVAIGPGGIFAIETKSHRGRIPIDRIDPRWLKQAYAERKLLERITGRRIEALLVFSDAYLVGSVPTRRQGVTILPARMLTGFLERRRPTMIATEAHEVAERLANAVA